MLKQQTSACCNLGQFSNNKTLVKLCCALLMICSILLESSTWAKIHSFIKISTSIETFLQCRKILNSDIRLTHINELSVWYWRCWMETETKQPVFILHSRRKIGHVLKQSLQNYYKPKNAWFFFSIWLLVGSLLLVSQATEAMLLVVRGLAVAASLTGGCWGQARIWEKVTFSYIFFFLKIISGIFSEIPKLNVKHQNKAFSRQKRIMIISSFSFY